MMEIARYKATGYDPGMMPAHDGGWVGYADHVAALEAALALPLEQQGEREAFEAHWLQAHRYGAVWDHQFQDFVYEIERRAWLAFQAGAAWQARAAPPLPVGAEPDDWQLVPKVARKEMLAAAWPYFVPPSADAGPKAWDAMLAVAPSAPPSEPGWRGMDSAPKDGTRILVGKRGANNIAIAAHAQHKCKGHPWREGYSLGRVTFFEPDVWMPLPPASPADGESS